MTQPLNIVRIGSTGAGKSLACARDIAASPDAELIVDPEKDSLAAVALVHANGNVLYDRLDDPMHALPYDLLSPSDHENELIREQENERQAEAFTAILLRRRRIDNLASTPLLEEHLRNLISFFFTNGLRSP